MWWQAVVGGFIGGSLGAVVGGLFQLRNTRLEQVRELQLAAVSDFAAVAVDVFTTLGASLETLGAPADHEDPHEWLAGMRRAEAEARSKAHDLTRLTPRLELLFGQESVVSRSGLALLSHVLDMTTELTKEESDVEVVTTHYEAAADAFGRFNAAAHRAISLSPWRSQVGRLSLSRRAHVSA